MILLTGKNFKGFIIIELIVVIGIISLLASIALPNYISYIERARTVQCLANRHCVEMEWYADNILEYSAKHENSLPKIDERWKCPSGGTYVWVGDSDHPKVICSIHGGVSLLPLDEENGEVLFSTDFDDMNNLIPLTGKWKVENGTLLTVGNGEHRLAFGDETWQNYEIKVNATLLSGSGYGIYYRADGNRRISGYCFQYDPGYGKGAFLVRTVHDGKEERPVQRVKIPDNFPVFNQSHDISVNIDGDHQIIKVDDEIVLDFYDDTFMSGMAGLRSWSKSQVSFQNVIVGE